MAHRQDRLSRTLFTKNILDTMRLRIVSGQYGDGFPLSEMQLAQEFGVSRGPVRTAVHSLEQEGLVKTLPNGRVHTVGFTLKRAEQMFDIRLYLEERAVREITRSDEACSRLLAIVDTMAETSSNRDLLTEVDIDFHLNLVEAADNWALLQAWRTLMPVVSSVLKITNRAYEDFNEILSLHRTLAERIRSGDPDEAVDILFRQIDRTKSVIIPILKRAQEQNMES